MAALLTTLASRAVGEEVTVPVSLQATFLAKVAPYDRGFVARAGVRAQILLVYKPDNAESVHVTSQLQSALGGIPDLAGLPHDEIPLPYPGPAELARQCKGRHVAVVFFAPGFRQDVPAIREALAGLDLLSVASVPDYVPAGIVLGFDVVSGRPKLLLHRKQARRQHVDLTAEVLKLMKVYE
jgi:hypothetical protein